MDTASAIARCLKFVDGVDPTVGTHTSRREKYLQIAQQGVIEISNARQGLYWTRGILTPTIAALGSSVSLGATFKEVGRDGKVYITALADEGRMEWAPPHQVQAEQRRNHPVPQPEIYSIFDKDTNGYPMLQTPPVSAATPLTIYCRLKAPTLTDAGTDSGLELIPEEYVYTVLLPYMRWHGFDDLGDDRARLWERRFEKGLADMVKTEKEGKETAQSVPGYGLEDHC